MVFRYREDVLQKDGTTKAIRRFHTVGPSKGDTRLSKKYAEVARDKFLATINRPTIQEKVADGLVLFGTMVEKYRARARRSATRRALAREADARKVHHLPRAAHRSTLGRPPSVRDQSR